MSLQICNTTRRELPEPRIARAIQEVLASEACSADSIEAIYCGNRMIRRINREFLQHDYVTDTITFRYNEGPEIEGEFYISLDVIESNAARFDVTFEDELLRVTIHSVLHLIGYDDYSIEERAEMTRLENHYLLRIDR
ncbi:MAG: rRNA maturation RNase YbeY [Chlorobiaceae bacterium]|nr:rRNA maturation RNase YbeY [Chlorobiaceae bacterium]